MNLRQISYFVTISECKSFLKASQVLHISQPTVSSQIRLLEEELDAVLFERRSSGVMLTPEGEEFLVYARNIVQNVQYARESLRMSRADAVGAVTVGIPGSLSPIVSIKLIEAVRRELPNVKLKVVSGMTGYLLDSILQGSIDFGLVFNEIPLYGLDLECLLTEYLCLVGRAPSDFEHLLDAESRVPLKKLAGLPLALPSMDHGLRKLIEAHARQAGVPLNISVELDASELLLEIVASTDMYTVYSQAALQGRAFQKLLHSARIVDPPIERKILLAHMAGRPLTRVARSVDAYVRKILLEAAASDWWELKP
jgi:LysR family nitrogen assimilation transcriptional regulator